MNVREAGTSALLRDASVLMRRDPEFAANLDRFVFREGIRGVLFRAALPYLASAERPVPWEAEDLLAELIRRKKENANAHG